MILYLHFSIANAVSAKASARKQYFENILRPVDCSSLYQCVFFGVCNSSCSHLNTWIVHDVFCVSMFAFVLLCVSLCI